MSPSWSRVAALGEVVIAVAASVDRGLRWFSSDRVTSATGISHRLTDAEDEQVLLRVFGITLVVAGLTTLLDASAAVGAFLVGLALTGQAAERSRALLSPLRDVFAAVFFVSFGLSIDPSTPATGAAVRRGIGGGHARHQGR